MNNYIGIDLGTSGLKAVLVSEDGQVKGIGFGSYPIDIPQSGYAEQDPLLWYNTLCMAVRQAVAKADVSPKEIRGIGISGHMHGTVLLDQAGHVLHPAVLWCDQRTEQEKSDVIKQIGMDQLGQWVQNNVNAGFQSLTLLWFRRHMPKLFEQTAHVLLPGDYLRYRLTGEISTERTGAASTLLFDNQHFCWNQKMLNSLGLSKDILPDERHSPTEIAGVLTAQAAEDTGLWQGLPVAFGGGDQPMGMIGNGLLKPGDASITLGTAGQVCVPSSVLLFDTKLRTNTFAYVPENTWYVMGATLNACLAFNWFLEKVLGVTNLKEIDAEAEAAVPGSKGLLFLPYLTGERTPHQDAHARGGFYNLNLSHNRGDMVRAVMEGVAYSLLDAMHVIQNMGLPVEHLLISGGGAKSHVWRQMIADIFGCPLRMTVNTEQAGLGAALCAMVACNEYSNIYEACSHVVSYRENVAIPNYKNREVYIDGFARFQEAYQCSRELMHKS